ncbi:MAG: alpha/beta hydrolase [Candidatus Hydrogenedentes bacterium]|nr:alpha/beta hydrolase [Candidatus Hydrogenedentota bacterium]
MHPRQNKSWSIALVALFAAVGGIVHAEDDAAALPYSRQENVVYAEVHGTGLLADIFKPTGTPNGKGIIDVVCGAWYSDRGKMNDHERAQVFNIFTKHGYVVFGMRPGSVSKYEGTELLANVQTAIRWVKTHSAEYGVDPHRLGLMGASAGGHLSLLASLTPLEAVPDAKKELERVDTRVKAVSVFFPPTDFVDWGGNKPDYSKSIGQLLFHGGIGSRPQDEIDARAKELSPRYRINGSNLPPYLLFHGDADPMVPLQQSQVFVDAVKAAGGSAELIVKPGGGHPWLTLPNEVEAMASWFDKQL